jgi:hypothetical protein
MSNITELIANLALDAASLGYEDADIRFAVRMASHVYTEELVRDYFERMFPREWPSKEVQAARDAAEKEAEVVLYDFDPSEAAAIGEKRRAKKAAKRRRYRANRAAAKRAAQEGNTAFVYAPAAEAEAEAPQQVLQEAHDGAPSATSATDAEVEAQPDAEEAHSVVTLEEADALLRSILRMAMEEAPEMRQAAKPRGPTGQHPAAPDAEQVRTWRMVVGIWCIFVRTADPIDSQSVGDP